MKGLLLMAFVAFHPLALPAQILPDKVIHLWVDPHYGDDQAAAQQNAVWAADVQDTVMSPAVLLHESWPFKTITAAINFLPMQTPPHRLPYVGRYATWKYAIIHALPGMYQRTLPAPNYLYFSNGLKPNGETFPILLPNGVSVQGTSALNTIFNLHFPDGAGIGPAFQFGTSVDNTGVDSFIDSVSVFGSEFQTGDSPPKAYAGIYLGNAVKPTDPPLPFHASSPTISNCFIYGNVVGIALDAGTNAPGTPAVHTPRLFNNTIAWNECGLWNGRTYAPEPTVGLSKPILVNNIFDATPLVAPVGRAHRIPVNWMLMGFTAFEGVDQSDLQVSSPTPGGDYNAYEWWPEGGGKFQRNWSRGPTFPQYPATTARIAPPTAPDPSRNIAKYTGWRGASNPAVTPRGVLYVRDLLYNAFELEGAMATAAQPVDFSVNRQKGYFDLSPGDFRLSPCVSDAGLNPTNRPWPPGDVGVNPHGAMNPLVNNGFHGTWPTPFQLIMANGQTVDNAPGPLPQAVWPYTCWSQDCEGYGNPRLVDHQAYPNGEKVMDIGADELGELIVAGYRFGTTHFQVDGTPDGRGQDAAQNHYLFFLGPYNAYKQPTHVARPFYSWLFHEPQWDYEMIPGRPYYWPCRTDVVPHLLPDLHPWWPVLISGFPGPSNPIWEPWLSTIRNPFLYLNPTTSVINPPGSGTGGIDAAGTPFLWLDLTYTTTTTQFGPYPSSGPPILVFDAWCMQFPGGNGRPWDDFSPLPALSATRFSLECADPPYGSNVLNMQSFMVWKRTD